MKLNGYDIEVKIKFLEEKKLKAIISLILGEIVIKGFRVQDSQYKNKKGDNLWLTPPSYRDNVGRYHPIFFIPNKDLWATLEEYIWDQYYKQREEYNKKRFDMSAENIGLSIEDDS